MPRSRTKVDALLRLAERGPLRARDLEDANIRDANDRRRAGAAHESGETVADCFRCRRHVGLEVALAALRDFLKTTRGGRDALIAAARADRVLALMRPYLEALS